jgi:hypothetical protein
MINRIYQWLDDYGSTHTLIDLAKDLLPVVLGIVVLIFAFRYFRRRRSHQP